MNMNTQNISLRTVMQNSSTMEAVMFVIVWWLDLQLPVQSVHIISKCCKFESHSW